MQMKNFFFTILSLVTLVLNLSLAYPIIKSSPATPRDLQLRYQEVCCSHVGIDPFLVWTKQIEHAEFKPYGKVPYNNQDGSVNRLVHAYPVWHTIYFWWYGWLTEQHAIMFGRVANFLLIIFIAYWVVKKSHVFFLRSSEISQFVHMALASIAAWPMFFCFGLGNYSILLAALLIIMIKALKGGHNYSAGFIWAIMMIKPQCAILMLFPLLWQKRFKTIMTAAGICIGSTLVMAWIYKVNPISLILEIPKIGGDFLATDQDNLMLKVLVGKFGSKYGVLWSLLFAVLCAYLTFRLRRNGSWWERIWPAVFFVPFWTYSKPNDWCILWPVYWLFSLTSTAFKKSLAVLVLGSSIFLSLWIWSCNMRWIDPAGIGIIFWMVQYFMWGIVAIGLFKAVDGVQIQKDVDSLLKEDPCRGGEE